MREPHRTEPYPRGRRSSLDAGRVARGRNIVHALVEVDITEARALLRDLRSSGRQASLTAYLIHRLGRAISEHPHLHAYLDWRKRLVIFQDVQILTMVEVDVDGSPAPMPHLLKSVDSRSLSDVTRELRAVQADPTSSPGWQYLRRMLALPGWVRRAFARVVVRWPHSFRAYSSTVLVTAVGMFGRRGGWAVPNPGFTLTVSLGGIASKPTLVEGGLEAREHLSVTLSVDHDVVDGAPMARFVDRFCTLVESGSGFEQDDGEEASPSPRA